MKFIVTCTQPDLTGVNALNATISIVDIADGSCIDVVTNTGPANGDLFGICFANGLLYASKESSLIAYDGAFNLVKNIPIPMPSGDIHQIVAFENKIYLTNTKHDTIIIFDVATEAFSEFNVTTTGFDSKHVNSMFFENGFIYVCCHNRGSSEVFRYDSNWALQDISFAGQCSHHIWRMNSKLWSFSSSLGAMQCLSDATKHSIAIPEDKVGFFRGVSQSNNQLVFGSSIIRRRRMTPEHVFEDIPTNSICGLIVMNTDTYAIDKVVELPQKIVVLDIIALPEGFLV